MGSVLPQPWSQRSRASSPSQGPWHGPASLLPIPSPSWTIDTWVLNGLLAPSIRVISFTQSGMASSCWAACGWGVTTGVGTDLASGVLWASTWVSWSWSWNWCLMKLAARMSSRATGNGLVLDTIPRTRTLKPVIKASLQIQHLGTVWYAGRVIPGPARVSRQLLWSAGPSASLSSFRLLYFLPLLISPKPPEIIFLIEVKFM